MKQESGIYLIYCLVNERVYVGSSVNVVKRLKQHQNELEKGKHSNSLLQRAWNKYGQDAFAFGLIERIDSEQLLSREQQWIDDLEAYDRKRGFNISRFAGSPMRGLTHTPNTKAKMSRSQLGRKHTDATKAKMSLWQKGRVLPLEQIERLQGMNKGRKASPETRAKLSAMRQNPSAELRYKFGSAMRGKKRTTISLDKYFEARADYWLIESPSGNKYEVKGLAKFCREHGLDQGSMSKVAQGKRISHKGWKCRKAE